MAIQWYIHQKNERLGPMTSLEVREALREGTVDPLDLVSREGSSVRIELYEVDEIFSVSNQNEQSNQHSELQPMTLERPISRAAGSDISGYDLKKTVESNPVKQSRKKASASNERSKRGRDPKKFFLYDKKKRKLGPLSAKEIQSIFYRGIVDQSAKVVKAGSDKKVPVATFVAVYAGSRAKQYDNEKTQVGGFSEPMTRTAVAVPSSRVLDELAMMRRGGGGPSALTNVWLPIIGILFGIAVGYWVIDTYVFNQPLNRRITATQENKATPKDKVKRKPQEIVRESPQPEPNQTQKRAVKKEVERKPQRKEVKKAPPPKTPPKVINRPPGQVRPIAPKVVPKRIPPRVVKPRTTPPIVRKAPARVPPPKASGDSGSVAGLRSKVGSIASAPNMRFSKAALSACSIRCTLTFTDSVGGSIRVVFFKGAFEDKLQKSSGRVTISGRISGSAQNLMMILQGVN